jgi:protein-tyrosine phosphatase
VIDLHSHVLPGLDDGPPDLAGSLALARAAVAAGTTRIAATPHVDRHFGVDPERIGPAREYLRERLAEAGIALDVVGGAEIALDRLVELGPAADELGLGGGRYLLVECPLHELPGDFEWPVYRLLERGVGVLLAHPERSPAFQRSPGRLRELLDAGARAQITAGAVRGDFGPLARGTALELARAGQVHDLASDTHDTVRRPPELGSAIRALAAVLPGGAAEAEWIARTAPAAILTGEPLPPRPSAAEGSVAAPDGRY